jgi:lysophospholipase L1-like esterase
VWQYARLLFTLCLVTVSVLLTGCDDDSTPVVYLSDTHDFGANDPNLIVAMGDSITVAINNVRPYPDMLASLLGTTVVNEGESGEHAYEGIQRVNGVLAQYRPGFLLILYGANDILHFRPADEIAENLRGMILAARAAQTIPIIATMTPMARTRGIFNGPVMDANHFIRAMAAEEGVLVVDLEIVFDGFDNDADPFVMEEDDLLQFDGLHPNETGNWEIALAFEGALIGATGGFPVYQPQ